MNRQPPDHSPDNPNNEDNNEDDDLFIMSDTHDEDTLYTHERLENKINILKRLTEISIVLNSTLKPKRLLEHIMDAAAEITNAQSASVLLWNSKTNELRFAATTTDIRGQELIGKPVPLEDSIAGKIWTEQKVLRVNNVQSEPKHYDKFDSVIDFQTQSILGVPLVSRNHPIGVLEVVNKRQLPWTEDDANYISILAAQAAVAIEGAQLVTALQKANEELSQLDKLKNDFIAIASHELRTPLGVILGYASFLQETEDHQVSEHASKVVGSAIQLRHIIEDLTNLRYIQANESDLRRDNIVLRDLLMDIQHDILSLSEAQGHRMRFNLPPEEIVVYVDRVRMGMVLSNLLNNSLRFTPQGGSILVSVETRDNREAWISITDNGIGIEETQLERIFEKFYQVEDHMTRKHGGLGIGLSIAKALTEAHGGRIWAKSGGLGQGATFTIALPLATNGSHS